MVNKQGRALLGAAAGAAMVIGLGLAPATAATATATWTVAPGGNFYTKYPATPELSDATTGARFPCPSGSVIHGTLKSGTGLADPVGTIAKAVGQAPGPIRCDRQGTVLEVTFGGLPWPIRAVHYDGASPGTTSGILTGVTGTITKYFSGPPCSAVIDGTAPGAGDGRVHFTYTNTGTFTLTGAGNLHFYHVSGCNGQIKDGDSMTYTASFGILATSGHGGGSGINIITSP